MGGHEKRRQAIRNQAAAMRKEMHRLVEPAERTIQSGDGALALIMQGQWKNLDVLSGHVEAPNVEIEILEHNARELERMLKIIRERSGEE